jgi:pimeloyl-ACP methyl ester carboxylesterase
VLHGALDKAVPVAEGSRLAELVPGAELVVMPQAGHAYLADRGTAATDTVLDFLGRHSEDRVA